MDFQSFGEAVNGTKLNSASMQVDNILNDTLLMKLNNATEFQIWWSVCKFPFILALFSVTGALLITLVVVLWLKRKMSKSDRDDLTGSESTEENPESQPMTASSPTNSGPDEEVPGTSEADLELKDYAGGTTQDEPLQQEDKVSEVEAKSGEEAEKQPEGAKAPEKGLLERRGSFASLSIDLPQPAFEPRPGLPTPTEEDPEEYLLSATNLLTPSQLAKVLEDPLALHNEFWDIPLNHPEKCEIALSGTKNRYETIMPNDRTRVPLDIESQRPLDTYINANYIKSYDGDEKAYIATQGPLEHTIQDFLLMIWTENTPAVVMITKFIEKGKSKCEVYFPTEVGNSLKFGDFVVTTLNVTTKEGYTVREMLIERNRDSRLIRHYWYDSWTDHQIPDECQTILDLATEIERYRYVPDTKVFSFDNDLATYGYGPVVIHCSAGIGRTGCFIAICSGIAQLKKERKVDILRIVCLMRYDRGGMIQTADQYEFVHQALNEYAMTLPGSSRH